MRRRHRRNRPLVIALYLNAALLTALLVAYLSRGTGALAFAAPPAGQQIAGGNGIYLMPAQFAQYNWGCYLLDTDKETLCAYEYMQGTKELKLVAARYVHHDREMHRFNTSPDPEEIKRINAIGNAPLRGQQAPAGVAPGQVPPGQMPPAVAPGNGGGAEGGVPPVAPGEVPATRPADEGRPSRPSTIPNFVPSVKDIQE